MIKIQEIILLRVKNERISSIEKLKGTLILYIISLFLTTFSVAIIYFIGFAFGYHSEIKDLLGKNLRLPSYYNFFLLLLIGPILEECIFRAFLSFKKTTIAISAFFFLVRFAPDFSYYHVPTKMFIVQIIVAVLLSVLLYVSLKPKVIERLKSYFLIFFWFSIVLFALVHVKNFGEVDGKIFFLYPLLVLPQFFMGWLLGYVRIKNGFLWGVLLHIMINFLPSLLMLFSLLKP